MCEDNYVVYIGNNKSVINKYGIWVKGVPVCVKDIDVIKILTRKKDFVLSTELDKMKENENGL